MALFGRKKADATPTVSVTAQLNARLQPLDRGAFEDALEPFLKQEKLGKIIGGGTMSAPEPAGIEYCDVEIELPEASPATIDRIIEKLERIGAPKGSILHLPDAKRPFGAAEGLALFLNGTDLPDNVYKTSDVNHVIKEAERLMGADFFFWSHFQGPRETALYFYGSSFVAMNAAIAPLVASYPLCQKARIEQIA